MKSFDEMSGAEKAAAFLVAMGHDAAAEIMRYLDENDVMKISREIAMIDKLSAKEREDLIGEFFIRLKKMKRSTMSGEMTARKILSDAFGNEKADSILSKVALMNLDDSFEFLKDVSPETIVDLVSSEHPQMIALMLAKMEPAQAGQVLKLLPNDAKKDAAMRLAKMGKISPEAVLSVSSSLKKKYDLFKTNESTSSAGGVNAIAGILNYLGGDAEKRIMDHFDSEIPDFANEVRKKVSIFEFETIASLTNKEIRLILGRITENRIIARALKGADDELKFRVLRNISSNRADDVISLIDLMGPVRLTDVNDARAQIVSVMKELSTAGKILIRKSGEEIVE